MFVRTDDGEDAVGFDREGFGRQSMSEKRRGHIDPRTSEFYQNIKKGKFYTSGKFACRGSKEKKNSWYFKCVK